MQKTTDDDVGEFVQLFADLPIELRNKIYFEYMRSNAAYFAQISKLLTRQKIAIYQEALLDIPLLNAPTKVARRKWQLQYTTLDKLVTDLGRLQNAVLRKSISSFSKDQVFKTVCAFMHFCPSQLLMFN